MVTPSRMCVPVTVTRSPPAVVPEVELRSVTVGAVAVYVYSSADAAADRSAKASPQSRGEVPEASVTRFLRAVVRSFGSGCKKRSRRSPAASSTGYET